jgi:hypothetical protein
MQPLKSAAAAFGCANATLGPCRRYPWTMPPLPLNHGANTRARQQLQQERVLLPPVYDVRRRHALRDAARAAVHLRSRPRDHWERAVQPC